MDIRKLQMWVVISTFIFFIWIWIYLNLDNTEEVSQTSVTKVKENNEKPEVKKLVAKETRLIIDSKCIWCGKCVRIDPQNFKMNYNTYKAEPISEENYIKSGKLDKAIKKCPVDSIHIIEV